MVRKHFTVVLRRVCTWEKGVCVGVSKSSPPTTPKTHLRKGVPQTVHQDGQAQEVAIPQVFHEGLHRLHSDLPSGASGAT